MAKISARGDYAAIKLRRADGTYVVVTRKGRLLAQLSKTSGYHVVDARYGASWTPNAIYTDRAAITRYLIEHRYPDAVEVA